MLFRGTWIRPWSVRKTSLSILPCRVSSFSTREICYSRGSCISPCSVCSRVSWYATLLYPFITNIWVARNFKNIVSTVEPHDITGYAYIAPLFRSRINCISFAVSQLPPCAPPFLLSCCKSLHATPIPVFRNNCSEHRSRPRRTSLTKKISIYGKIHNRGPKNSILWQNT